ncbi:Uncharacterised protein [Streptococcus pneumoniae]|nr:Uncharacterised protein [Streptococcus pneumoniae]
MFILRHGTREDKPFLRSVVIGVTGLDISCSEEKKAMRFVSRGAAVQVGKALRVPLGIFIPLRWSDVRALLRLQRALQVLPWNV